MAYNFTAEKRGLQDLHAIHHRLSQFDLLEFFPVEVSSEHLTLGISIPFKVMDEPRFAIELTALMTYLVSAERFEVVDLFTGNAILVGDIAALAEQISA